MLTLATTSPLQDHLEAEFMCATTMEPSSAAPAGRRTWCMERRQREGGGSGSRSTLRVSEREKRKKQHKPSRGGGGGGLFPHDFQGLGSICPREAGRGGAAWRAHYLMVELGVADKAMSICRDVHDAAALLCPNQTRLLGHKTVHQGRELPASGLDGLRGDLFHPGGWGPCAQQPNAVLKADRGLTRWGGRRMEREEGRTRE